jgi:hypothetical protein
LPIFTAEIEGTPTLVLAAHDYVAALAFVNDSFVRTELCSLRTPDGGALWNGKTDVTVRPASPDEEAVWERSLAEDLAQGVHASRADAIESNGFAFLVEYLESGE